MGEEVDEGVPLMWPFHRKKTHIVIIFISLQISPDLSPTISFTSPKSLPRKMPFHRTTARAVAAFKVPVTWYPI